MSDTTPPNPHRAHQGLSVQHTAAASESAALQQRRRNDEISKAGRGVPLPGGIMAPLEAFHGIAELPTQDATKYLAQPEVYILKDPAPGAKYVWAARDDKYGGDLTSGAIRSGRYRPVKKSEIRDNVDFDLHFKTGTGTNQYVCWRDLMLCEVPEAYARRQYDGPVSEYIRHMRIQQDGFMAGVEQQSRGLAVGKATTEISPA